MWAGGSAKQARDRHFQAILPLRGKILNVERSHDADIYKNNEIASLIVALGLGVKGSDKLQGLRYGKVTPDSALVLPGRASSAWLQVLDRIDLDSGQAD